MELIWDILRVLGYGALIAAALILFWFVVKIIELFFDREALSKGEARPALFRGGQSRDLWLPRVQVSERNRQLWFAVFILDFPFSKKNCTYPTGGPAGRQTRRH